ncbi:hypothetical protein [Frondihabitans sp. PAMC 28766]|uniref:hypothetical protein n=1 Tax=Frondihabitans sp. PAMC 28766 TaxID=1795630 RepID=UPI0012FF9D77|nr:hypothetical protein [Frondihabitans sp. PAMC 28766]
MDLIARVGASAIGVAILTVAGFTFFLVHELVRIWFTSRQRFLRRKPDHDAE